MTGGREEEEKREKDRGKGGGGGGGESVCVSTVVLSWNGLRTVYTSLGSRLEKVVEQTGD